MDKQMIEEMAKDIACAGKCTSFNNGKIDLSLFKTSEEIAETLYHLRYCKIPEGSVVLTEEGKQKLLHEMYEQGKFDALADLENDGKVILTKDEYESLKKGVHTVSYQAMITESDQQHWLDGYKVGYKDGVIAVGVQTKQALEKIKTELIGETKNDKH